MATTTNYGWTTPDDTALVKDGAAAIRTLGTSVDTTTKNLNPETTLGDISYRSSTANVNTRLPLGTAGQVLKVNSGATAPEWSSDNAGMTNPMTTTGDTIYSSSGSTPARLAIGSTGQVLTVAGGVPSWAAASSGALTFITSATAANTAVSLSINDCFSTTYKNYLILANLKTSGNTNGYFRLRASGTDSTTGYYYGGIWVSSGSTTVQGYAGANQSDFIFRDLGATESTYQFVIGNPFESIDTNILSNGVQSWTGSNVEMAIINGSHRVASSYTGFTIASDSNLTGTVEVYGYAKS